MMLTAEHMLSIPFFVRVYTLLCIVAGLLSFPAESQLSSMDRTVEGYVCFAILAIGECLGYMLQSRMRHQFIVSRMRDGGNSYIDPPAECI